MSKITQEDHDKALEMLRQGMSVRDIADATGHTPPPIRAIAKQHGITPAKRRTVADYDEVIMRMAGEGRTDAEIGAAIGYSTKTVHAYLGQKRRDAKDPAESEDSNLTFAEPRPVRISRVESKGRVYMDVTDIFCPG